MPTNPHGGGLSVVTSCVRPSVARGEGNPLVAPDNKMSVQTCCRMNPNNIQCQARVYGSRWMAARSGSNTLLCSSGLSSRT
jgi:hypothetical protein